MTQPDLLDLVQQRGVEGFLEFVEQSEHAHLSAKIGGTGMTNVMEERAASQVLQGIDDLRSKFHGKLVLIVSAAGKIYGSEQKITDRLIAALKAFHNGDKDEGERIIQSLKEDHLKMIGEGIQSDRQEAVINVVENHFLSIQNDLADISQRVPAYILDRVAGIGEELASIILAAMLNGIHLSTQNNSVQESTDETSKNFAFIIREFSQMIQTTIQQSDSTLNIVPGFPGFIDPSGTISETGRGYSDFTTIMATPEKGFVILLKQSGAVLQMNPKFLPEGYDIRKMTIMPIRQAVRMTNLIGDQIQVIHPMALAEAQKKKLTLIVTDEKNPFSGGGTLILPDDIYDAYQADGKNLEPIPMMGVAENAYRLTIFFDSPISEMRKSRAISELEQRLANSGVKVAYKDFTTCDDDGKETLSLIVAGMDSKNDSLSKKIGDIMKIEKGELSYILGISGVGRAGSLIADESKILNTLQGARCFHRSVSEKLTSLGILVPQDNESEREQKLESVMRIINSER
ncbi:hypothetical protein HYV57_04690 [Candidatus Peregrinibacteria bacterium]|nr:hypothetical protein [Candidatus Peregrinibacteria bacterium]